MFYAHFVLSKKGPLARIWLAAHWDKKLTKAHVFETNIDSSVEAILKPKVKMALRTSGHLLLGVVRIYSRKAKYLLADCNEAFVKIKMAFRPGVVDLPEENREAAVAAITLQENFHDFETTLADLEDIDVQAQFSVNQSRPEEITMREDLGSITLMGDDGFGDVGFDEREILHDGGHLDDALYKSGDAHEAMDTSEKDHTLMDNSKNASVDLEPPNMGDDFGGAVGDGFMDHDDVEDNEPDDFGDVDQELFGGDFMGAGGLFEDPPTVQDTSGPKETEESEEPAAVKPPEEAKKPSDDNEEPAPLMSSTAGTSAMSSIAGEQTTLVPNEDEAFALEPLDITSVPGAERRGKRKRKLIVDEQKGIPSETMKFQLSDTSDIVSTLDLAPPTKKLMHWKETGGVEKLFALPARPIISKITCKLFSRNLQTRPMKDDADQDISHLPLDVPDVARDAPADKTLDHSRQQPEMSTISEEPSNVSVNASVRSSRRSEQPSVVEPPPPRPSEAASVLEPQQPTDLLDPMAQIPDNMTLPAVDVPTDPSAIVPTINPLLDEGPPSVAPFSVPPPSVGPQSVGPNITFDEMEDQQQEAMPENAEQEEKRWSKRTQQMQNTFDIAFRYQDVLSFKDMARNLNRKQVASRFYTLLVLKKHKAVEVEQTEAFGDISISKGPQFGIAC